jgi:hypothetical protein
MLVHYKMTLGSKENYIKKQWQLSMRRASTGLTVGEALLALLAFIQLVPFSHAI